MRFPFADWIWDASSVNRMVRATIPPTMTYPPTRWPQPVSGK
jgi:hypothetical protein